MNWQYQTLLFEFRKDGLLGDKYIDDEEVENILNEQGMLGWELVNVTPVQEGLLAFLKKEIGPEVKYLRTESVRVAERQGEETAVQEEPLEHVQVKDQELVSRSEKKAKSSVRGENDLIGGIKIS